LGEPWGPTNQAPCWTVKERKQKKNRNTEKNSLQKGNCPETGLGPETKGGNFEQQKKKGQGGVGGIGERRGEGRMNFQKGGSIDSRQKTELRRGEKKEKRKKWRWGNSAAGFIGGVPKAIKRGKKRVVDGKSQGLGERGGHQRKNGNSGGEKRKDDRGEKKRSKALWKRAWERPR